jgi:hypothetical protein
MVNNVKIVYNLFWSKLHTKGSNVVLLQKKSLSSNKFKYVKNLLKAISVFEMMFFDELRFNFIISVRKNTRQCLTIVKDKLYLNYDYSDTILL